MKALSLWQPWASLVALGAKKIETRSWATGYRGPLVIHASVNTTGWGRKGTRTVIQSGGFVSGYEIEKGGRGAGLLLRGPRLSWPYRLPLGAAVAYARLVDCVEMTDDNIADVPERERALGRYEPGRFMWLLSDVYPFEPVECVGRQGLFTPPRHVAVTADFEQFMRTSGGPR